MADTIESFVEKLHKDGVEAGRAEAQKLLDQAKAQAEQVVADAKGQAERILADARGQAAQTVEHGRNELDLAARDVFGRLRQTITDAVGEVLRRSAADALKDEEFLVSLLHDVVVEYARKDAEGTWPIEIRLDEAKADGVIQSLLDKLAGEGGAEPRVDLKGKLKSAGFEYAVSGGVVEVTAESIAGVLGEIIAPRLRELIDRAAAGEGE